MSVYICSRNDSEKLGRSGEKTYYILQNNDTDLLIINIINHSHDAISPYNCTFFANQNSRGFIRINYTLMHACTLYCVPTTNAFGSCWTGNVLILCWLCNSCPHVAVSLSILLIKPAVAHSSILLPCPLPPNVHFHSLLRFPFSVSVCFLF